jgi:hypothetical protein
MKKDVKFHSSQILLPLIALISAAVWLAIHFPHGSFWYDEALTTYVATDSWASLWHWCTQVDIQVPFHYLVLRGWAVLLGDSEFTLRLLSALSILLTTAALIAIGRRLVRGGAIFAAMTFMATPGLLWVAYEVRAYALALALYAWATFFLLVILDRGSNQRDPGLPLLAAYALLMIAVLYTHYTGIAALAAHAAILGIAVLRTRSQRFLITAIGTLTAIGLAFAPWLPILLTRSGADRSYYTGDPIPPAHAVGVMLDFKLHGQDTLPDANITTAWIFGALTLIGLGVGLRAPKRTNVIIPALIVVFPVVMTAVIVYFKPKLAGRYAWSAWIGVDLLISFAIAALWRLRRIGAIVGTIAVCVLVTIPWVFGVRGGPPNSDFRGAFAYICAQGTPNDVILLRDGTLFVTAKYYDRRCPTPHPTIVGLPDALLTDVTVALTLPDVQAAIPPLLAKAPPNVWVIAWQGDVMDPQAMLYALLDGTGDHSQRMFGDVALDRYIRPHALGLDPVALGDQKNVTPVQNGPTLRAIRLLAPDQVHVGDQVVVQTWWTRGAILYPDLHADVQITTVDGGYTYAEQLMPPAGWKYFDDHWSPGIPTLGRYAFTIAGYMPDHVKLRLILSDAQNRWPPQVVPIASLTVEP